MGRPRFEQGMRLAGRNSRNRLGSPGTRETAGKQTEKKKDTHMRLGRKIFWAFVVLWLVLTAYLLLLSDKWASAASPAHAAAPFAVTSENFPDLLRETLQKNPDLLLSILRENSESVLDIAQEGSNQRRRKALLNQWKMDLAQPKEVRLEGTPIRGKADAPVTIVAFSDFTCPYCEQGAATISSIMKRNEGKVRYVFKHYPLDKDGIAQKAAEYHVAAALQGDDKAWALYDLLFERRNDVLKRGVPALEDAAKDAGLDMKKLSSDLKKKSIAAAIDADIEEGTRLGVQGTPYFLVNNLVIRGSLSPTLFNEAIMMALQAAGKH